MSVDPRELFVKSTLKIKKSKGDYWAKLKVHKVKDGVDYFDVWTGQNHEGHEHLRLNLDGTQNFHAPPNEKNPRNQLESIHRKIESEFHGTLVDEHKQLKNTRKRIKLIFKTIINPDTREVTISIFDFEIL